MKKSKINFINLNIIFATSLILFISFKYFRVDDLSEMFNAKEDEKILNIFLIKDNLLEEKSFNIESRKENIEEILRILNINHREVLNIDYIVKNIYINEQDLYISLKFNKNNLDEITEPLFVYSIVNSIKDKRVKFINTGKGKIFRFLDEDTFFEVSNVFRKL